MNPKILSSSPIKIALSCVMLACSAGAVANQSDTFPVRPGTVIYKPIKNAEASELKALNALLKSQGLQSQEQLPGSKLNIATFKGKGRENAIANILKRSGYVEFAEPDRELPPILTPNDPAFGNQWHHNNINSQQAWDITTGSKNVLVAVCDTGFDVNHPDLAANLRTDLAFNAQDGSNYIFDANGHGTGTAGTLGAVGNNSVGVAGVNWDVDIIPVRIAISDSNSSAYISTMAKCIEYAADNGARVVNLSYGGIQYSTIDAAAQYLRDRNGLLFMSAGNDGQEFPEYPDYPSFIGVGATTQSNTKASFSSFGTYVDLVAPGVGIRTTVPNNGYVNYSGTSFSSPIAAGVAALMVSANPSLSVDDIENGILSTTLDLGTDGDDNVFGRGLVDAHAAVTYALNVGSFIPPVAEITTSSNSVPFGTAVSFSAANAYDPDGNITAYLWNLGDGTSSNQSELTHTYTSAGSYSVSLTVTDNDGQQNTASVTIQVTNELPVAVIDAIPSQYNVGDTIFFNGSGSFDNDGTITSYFWEFGDGQTGNGVNTNHSYTSTGNYTVLLTVTDNAGALNSTSIDIAIVDPFALTAPSNLTAAADGLSITLNWQDTTDNETAFVVERGTKIRGKTRFNEIATLPINATSYVDTLVESGTYSYRVKAVNSSETALSNTVRITAEDTYTPPPPGNLNAPSNLVGTNSGNAVALTWQDNSSDELGFHIERGLKRKGKVTFSRIGTVGLNITSFDDDETKANGSYVYRIQAFNDTEVSAYSNTFEVRIK